MMQNGAHGHGASSSSVGDAQNGKSKNILFSIYRKFHGNCEEAFAFYKHVFGGQLLWKTRWSDARATSATTVVQYKQDEEKIMHMGMLLTDNVKLMGCDEVTLVEVSTEEDDPFASSSPPSTSPSSANKREDGGGDNNGTNSPRRSKRQRLMKQQQHQQQQQKQKQRRRLFHAETKQNPMNKNMVNMHIPIAATSIQHANKLFQELTKDGSGGIVQLPISTQPWGNYLGMCMDRFGTQWMIEYHSDNDTTTTTTP